MHGNLAWIKGSDADRAERGAVAHSRYKSRTRVVRKIRAAKTTVEIATQFRMIKQIGSVRGDLQFDSLANRKGSSQTEVNIETARPPEVSDGRGGVAHPILIGDEASVWRLQPLALKRAGVVLEERVLGRRHYQAAGQRDFCFAVVPVLQLRRHRQGDAGDPVGAGHHGSGGRTGYVERHAALRSDYCANVPIAGQRPAEAIANRKVLASTEGRLVRHHCHKAVRLIGESILLVLVRVDQVSLRAAEGTAGIYPLAIFNSGAGVVQLLRPCVVEFQMQSRREGMAQPRIQ